MSKIKLIGFIAIGLLISNLILLSFLFHNKDKPPLREGPKKIIIERLHFDPKQIADYEKLIGGHRKKINEMDSLIIVTKNQLYAHLNSNNQLLIDSLQNKLGQFQIEIEKVHYNHFLDIKKLCRENQMDDFNALIKDLSHLFGRQHGPQPRP